MSKRTLEKLQDELETLAAHIYAGTCRFLELVGEIDARGQWDSMSGSCAEWLAWRCGLLPRTAREHVRVARRLRELPLIQAAFAAGQHSYAKVRALTRVAERAQAHHNREQLGVWWEEDGSLVIHGRLAPEDAALFVRALDAMRESLWEARREAARGSAEPRPTNAEAAAVMADAALSGATRTGSERSRGRLLGGRAVALLRPARPPACDEPAASARRPWRGRRRNGHGSPSEPRSYAVTARGFGSGVSTGSSCARRCS